MTKPASQDIARLPKWAQDRIRLLEANLRYANGKLDAMTGDPKLTNTTLWDYSVEKGLPKGSTIKFWTGPREQHWNYIDVRVDDLDGCLVIHGGDQIAVAPTASNAIKIYTVRMDDIYHGNR